VISNHSRRSGDIVHGAGPMSAVVVAYVINALGAAVSDIEVLRKLSPFYWSDGGQVLADGFQPAR